MGGANATEPNQPRAQMNNTQGRAADRAASDRGARRHVARQDATRGSQRNDQAENAVTEQLNRQQIANAGSPAQTATQPTDCSTNQPGCAPAPGSRGVGTLP
jgi:hypothetical protein